MSECVKKNVVTLHFTLLDMINEAIISKIIRYVIYYLCFIMLTHVYIIYVQKHLLTHNYVQNALNYIYINFIFLEHFM